MRAPSVVAACGPAPVPLRDTDSVPDFALSLTITRAVDADSMCAVGDRRTGAYSDPATAAMAPAAANAAAPSPTAHSTRFNGAIALSARLEGAPPHGACHCQV